MTAPAIAGDRTALGEVMDALPLSPFHVWSVLLIAATVILDGLDNQMLGLAAPSLAAEWRIGRETLGLIFALGFVGMGFGTLGSGWIGDRFGRRWALIAGVALFGLATLLTGFAADIGQVAVLKTAAGVGLGGVPGTAAAMIAEFAPARWRSVAVTFGVVCVSVGGIVGGTAAAIVLPLLGWRWLFYLAGGFTLAFVLLLLWLLPESPRYLARRPGRSAELARTLRRLGHAAPLEADRAADIAGGALVPLKTVLHGPLLRDAAALSMAMLSGMFMIYLMFNWAPTLLASAGFPLATSSLGLTSFNLGGTVGACLAALTMVRLGSRAPLILMATVGAGVCVFLAVLPVAGGRNEPLLLAGLCALGLFASAAQSATFAVGAHVFPTAIRARGMGLMGAAGRTGALLSALGGAWLVGAANAGFFGLLAVLMAANAVAFVALRGHIPRLVGRPRSIA